MNRNRFETVIKQLDAGEQFAYHVGCVAIDRVYDADLDYIARFVNAAESLGLAHLTQKRLDGENIAVYYVTMKEKLGMRADGNGSFQEAQRVAGIT